MPLQLSADMWPHLKPRELARFDPVYYSVHYLKRLKPPRPMPAHQIEFFGILAPGGIPRPGKFLKMMPRGHGKTDLGAFCYPSWRISNDHNIRTLFVGETDEPATKHSFRIKKEFEENHELINDFGIRRGHPWRDGMFYLQRDAKHKDPTVEAVGLSQAITGGRFELIIADDMLSEFNTLTSEMRRKIEQWFLGTLDPILTPNGQWIIIGTCKHYDDIYQKLRKPGSGWHTTIKQAILDEEKGIVLWKEEWPYHRLKQKREEWMATLGPIGGLVFLREYQNEAVHLEGQEFKLEWLQYWGPDHHNKPAGLPRYAGVDPAVGKRDQASYTAIVTIEVDTVNHQTYVVDLWRGRVSMGNLPKAVGNLYEKWKWRAVAIESVFWQAELARSMSHYGLPVIPVDYRRRRVPKDKIARLQELGLPFSQRSLFLPQDHPQVPTFVNEEYMTFPDGARTDLLDALWLALNVAPKSGAPRYDFV